MRLARVVGRIQAIHSPQLLAARGVVPGDHVAAGHDDLHPVRRLAHLERGGCRIAVRRFLDCPRRTLRAPHRLPGLAIDPEKIGRFVGFHPVQDLDEQIAVLQQRRRRVSPIQAELAVVLLDVPHPQLFPVEIERLQDADAGHHPNGLAVGHRRRGRHVLLALDVIAARDVLLPPDPAIAAIQRPQLEVAGAVGGADVEEDGLAPDDRRRPAAARHRELPGDVLRRAPLQRQPLFRADAVFRRTAPLRPVLGGQRGGSRHGHKAGSHETLHADASTDVTKH